MIELLIFTNKTAHVYILRKLGVPDPLHLSPQTNISDIFSIILLDCQLIIACTYLFLNPT